MKQLLTILLSPLCLSAQKINIGIGVGTTQGFGAATAQANFYYKRILVEYSQVIPITRVNRQRPLLIPKVGYQFGNLIPYLSYNGGGFKIQANDIQVDAGMVGKYTYLSLTINSNKIPLQKINKDVATYALCFISGFANGSREAMQHHWPEVSRMYPDLNSKFWNPAISWTNKNRNWISKAVPTFTDGYHLLQFVERGTLVLSLALQYGEKPNLKKIITKAVAAYAANRIGHYVSYNLIFKNK